MRAGLDVEQQDGRFSESVRKPHFVEYIWVLATDVSDDQIGLTDAIENPQGQFSSGTKCVSMLNHLETRFLERGPHGVLDALPIGIVWRDNEDPLWLHRFQFNANWL